MGIGNVRTHFPVSQIIGLITPHGDREHERQNRSRSSRIRPLITPHGDREPRSSNGSNSPSTHSLPLMGIGNSGRPSTRSCCTISLPLMGIGNRTRLVACGERTTAHYPSWGSGTGKSLHGLIRDQNSLPLMGIGNQTDRHPDHQGNCDSLPLMGIGNNKMAFLDDFKIKLITPHGDREPSPAVPAWMATPFSLPLMGIGNPGLMRRFIGHEPISLPLMGIGNSPRRSPTSRRPRSHYPSWGSGTESAPGRGQRTSLLITPHGDRERGTCCRQRSAPGSHYPSWGSGTHTRIRHGMKSC